MRVTQFRFEIILWWNCLTLSQILVCCLLCLLCTWQVISRLMAIVHPSVLQSQLRSWDNSNYLAIAVIKLFVSLVGTEMDWDHQRWRVSGQASRGDLFPVIRWDNIFPHTDWTAWTGSSQSSPYISLSEWGKWAIVPGYNRLSPRGRKVSNLEVITSGAARLYLLYQRRHALGKQKQRRPWWDFPSSPPVCNRVITYT